MKKVGLAVFILAIIVGIAAGSFFSFGRLSSGTFKFSIGRGVKGSGVLATEKRDVAGFTGVKASGVFQVEVTAQKDYSVEVSADDNIVPMVRTYVADGVLRIETDGRFSNTNPIRVRVSAPNIESLDASGASRMTVTDLKNSSLDAEASGASRITLAGETMRLTADASGASSIDAEGLRAGNANVDASGASSVSVTAIEHLSADASGASRVSYSGTPASVEKRASGAGKIFQK